jgi:hypothetical protein
MALDPIIRGCTWQATLYVDPGPGNTIGEIIAELTNAVVLVQLVDSTGIVRAVSSSSSIVSPTDRKIEAAFTADETSDIAPGIGFILDVRVTTDGGQIRPIQVREKIEVRPFTMAVGR